MSQNKFNDENLKTLLDIPANKYLSNLPEKKYDDFGKFDPFPEISPALLNSVDIIKYVLTTGMIHDFNPDDLDGATYTCRFSGEYTYLKYSNETKENTWENGALRDNDELVLPPNSITFLKIKTKFRIPIYIVARFNIKVFNAYKGLLLGTGPIVDPGFVGNLYIPLHNLTSNEYCIKEGAKLICVEFTKLSLNESWDISKNKTLDNKRKRLDFSMLSYTQEEFESFRDINKYLKKALVDDDRFRKKTSVSGESDILSVGSSIPEAIKNIHIDAEKARKSVEISEKTIRKYTFVGVIAGCLAVAAILVAIFAMFYDMNARVDNLTVQNAQNAVKYQELQNENKNIQQEIALLKEAIERLEKQIESLQNDIASNKNGGNE